MGDGGEMSRIGQRKGKCNRRADSEVREIIGGIREGCSLFSDKRLALCSMKSCCVVVGKGPRTGRRNFFPGAPLVGVQ